MSSKLKAFTIMEVTVTMLVVSILIGITYTAYNIISRSFAAFSSKQEEISALLTVDKLLKKDFSRAGRVVWLDSRLTCFSARDTVWYEFSADNILRAQGTVDTFRVSPLEVLTFFEKQRVLTINETKESGLIDGLSFQLMYQGEKVPYFYHKIYSAEDLINGQQGR
jgi:prepilin-type N-terminal cleavage/methylation domain-containing protein